MTPSLLVISATAFIQAFLQFSQWNLHGEGSEGMREGEKGGGRTTVQYKLVQGGDIGLVLHHTPLSAQ